MSTKSPTNWLNTIFLIATPVIGIVGTILLIIFGTITWPTWVLAGAMMLITGFSVTGGYHRLFAHRSYEARWPVKLVYLLFSAGAFEGSCLEWCTDHRNHHRYTETDKDPYNIHKGFLHAHINWLIKLDTSKRDFSNVKDLQESAMIRWQHKYYVYVALFMGLVLPTIIAAFWGQALAGFIVAGVLRVVFVHHSTFFINSFCHMFGKRPYSKDQTAVDNWLLAIFTFGEGYHNYHHQFPIDYRNGIKFYHFDPTKWIIKGLNLVGLAKNLRRMDKEKIDFFKARAASSSN